MAAACVTGVGRRRGIGAGIAVCLAEDGWDLALSYWQPYDRRLRLEGTPEDPQILAEKLRSRGRQIELVEVDLEDPAGASSLVGAAAERLGQLDALVMSHCESVASGVLDTTVESFDRHYAVNIRATWLLIAAFAHQLGSAGGVAVALTSDHTVGNLPYGVTKGGLDRLVLAAAHELGDVGLRTNVINPGPVDTGWMDDSIRAAGLAQHPTGRLGYSPGHRQPGAVPALRTRQLDQRPAALQQRRLPHRPPPELARPRWHIRRTMPVSLPLAVHPLRWAPARVGSTNPTPTERCWPPSDPHLETGRKGPTLSQPADVCAG